MNICFINTGYPSPTTGGVERVTYNLATFLQSRHYSVFCLVLEGKLPPKQERICPCYCLPDPKGLTNDENLLFFRTLQEKLHLNILVIQSEKNLAAELCEKAKVPGLKIVSVCHGSPMVKCDSLEDELTPRIMKDGFWYCFLRLPIIIIRHVYRNHCTKKWFRMKHERYYALSDAYVTLSSRFHPEIQTFANVKSGEKLCAISNFLALPNFSETTTKENIIVWVGRMCFSPKRPDRIIKIWENLAQKYPDWQLYMVGSGEALPILKKYVFSRKIPRVVFVGLTDPVPFYQKAKILCMTSSYEGWGLVLAEAMNYRCVPIAYASYASLHDIIIDGKNGFSIRAFQQKKYCYAMQKLMNDPVLLKRMGVSGEHSVQRFSKEKIGQQWIDLFARLVANVTI